MANIVFVAPPKVYKDRIVDSQERTESAGWTLPNPIGLTKTKTGGLATIFPGHPFPRKTYVYYGITQPNNKVKRITLSLFLPFASLRHGLKAFINSYLWNFNRLVDSIYHDSDQIPYLHYEYYSEFGKALWDFVYFFLKKLGVNDEISYRTGLMIATMIEYDDAYMVRLQDILSESTKEALYKNPKKELDRLMDIYKQREIGSGEGSVWERIAGVAKLVGWLTYIPPVKKAFRFALDNVNFEWFQFDQWDIYWTFFRNDYNVKGKTFEQRSEAGKKIMEQYAKKTT